MATFPCTAPVSGRRLLLAIALACGVGSPWSGRADTHIYAGAATLLPGSPLLFTVAGSFDVASGYYLPMVLRSKGIHAGFYRGDTLTFTALPAADIGTGQLEGRALFGARVAVQLVSVEGPAGGEIEFWEGDGENPGNTVTFRLTVGTRDATETFVISENDGSAGADPYGHIHGREFTTNLPGRYVVGFRLVDLSTNGPNGGPLHSPSAVLRMAFQAGPTIDSIERVPGTASTRIRFRSAPGVSNVLEAATTIDDPQWVPVAGPVRGNSTLQVLAETNAAPDPRFYRLRLLNIPQ